MKVKKQNLFTFDQLEKILSIAGVLVILIGCIANIYSAYFNRQFIHSPSDYLYYLRYMLLLGGGFIIGYLAPITTNQQKSYKRLFIGVSYAILAISLFLIFDLVRVAFQGLNGSLPYPWSKIMFLGVPFLAFIVTFAVAYISQIRASCSSVSTASKTTIIGTFVGYQIYSQVSGAFYYLSSNLKIDLDIPIWLVCGSIFISPLAVTIITYLCLNKIVSHFDRMFYSTYIGALYGTLTLVLWEFRTDPGYISTNIFSGVVVIVSLLFVGILLWRANNISKIFIHESKSRS